MALKNTLKKPQEKDFMCDNCGMIHDWEYKEALKKYNLRLNKEKKIQN